MNITHHKNGEIKTLVEEAPYHPGYEDAGFKPKVVNNKPVAWIDEINTFVLDKDYKQFPKFLQHGMIPLYTHPVKEPTDLELLKMIGEKFTRFGFEGDYVVEDSELVEFARAILRKAQEK